VVFHVAAVLAVGRSVLTPRLATLQSTPLGWNGVQKPFGAQLNIIWRYRQDAVNGWHGQRPKS